jgi:hypothetical protein
VTIELLREAKKTVGVNTWSKWYSIWDPKFPNPVTKDHVFPEVLLFYVCKDQHDIQD